MCQQFEIFKSKMMRNRMFITVFLSIDLMIFFKKNPDLTTIRNLIGTNKKDEKACSRIVIALHAKQHNK